MHGRIPLERLRDNPFQMRMDYAGIEALAASIAAMALIKADTSGLLQVPPARIVVTGGTSSARVLDPAHYGGVLPCLADEPHAVVQLAAGHRRLRAFQHLAAAGGRTGPEYSTFPVDVQVLSDQAMDDIAAAENANRQDLSVIEEAASLQRTLEHFGLSQEQVGARRGLTQAAVSNKIRLLQLPDWCKALIHDGEITERHGRAVLPWLQLPGFTFHAGDLKNRLKRDEWLSVAELEGEVRNVINARAQDLAKAPWTPRDTWLPDAFDAGVVGPCGGCQHNVSLLRGRRCVQKSCYAAKERAFARLVTGPAEAAKLHPQHRAWRTLPPEPTLVCQACKTAGRDVDLSRPWYRPLDRYFPTVCPDCWTRAGLEMPAPPAPAQASAATASHPAPAGHAPNLTAAPPRDDDTGDASPEWDDEPAEGTDGDVDNDDASRQPARPVPNMQPIAPPPPAALLLTARILLNTPSGPYPGVKPVMMAIGPEGRGPSPDCTWTGVLMVPGRLGETVETLARTYFQGNTTAQSPAEEEQILMEVTNA